MASLIRLLRFARTQRALDVAMLYEAGGVLDEAIRAIAGLADYMRSQVAVLPDHYFLRSDDRRPVEDHWDNAHYHLEALVTALGSASNRARLYHGEVSHIGVEGTK
ncbi:hypothetical protein ABT340_15870 [Streptosporangium sp. NPDC000239]|uniref:hypothetical protein n=1 Tax=Streptosporangium sp. NPDC000239 TaxID=3154248 RepID=UPI00331AB68B